MYTFFCIILIFIFFYLYRRSSSFTGCSLLVKVKNGVPHLEKIFDNHENRAETISDMIKKVYILHGEKLKQNTSYCISGDDINREGAEYQIVSGDKKIPDWAFERWDDANVPRFHSDFYPNYKPVNFKDKYDYLFWIGSIDKHVNRFKMYEQFGNREHDGYKVYQNGDIPFTSIEDHGKYKYLIDVEGRGYSDRLKFLFMLNSVIFVCDRPYTEYWHDLFEPWVHYVPVNRDFSNLEQNYTIMRNDQLRSEKMARECRERALEVFSEDAVYKYYAKILA